MTERRSRRPVEGRRSRSPLAVALMIAVAAGALLLHRLDVVPASPAGGGDGEAAILQAFHQHTENLPVEVEGRVQRLLADDLTGSRHQRFILRLDGGHTLLVSHNIDLAQRIPLRADDRVRVRGRYEWNERGGVIHWTHHDPQGRDPGGWIRLGDRTFR